MKLFAAALGLLAITSMATAQTVTQSDTGPAPGTFDNVLTFDEDGGPIGPVNGDEWLADFGITIQHRNGANGWVNDYTGGGLTDPVTGAGGGDGGTIGEGNSYTAIWGEIVDFGAPVASVSVQIWNSAGPGSPIFGGFNIFLRDIDGNNVGFPTLITPAWNDAGMAWVNIETAGAGADIHSISFADTSLQADLGYMDNLHWNLVPAPGALALLGLAGLARRRRRQA